MKCHHSFKSLLTLGILVGVIQAAHGAPTESSTFVIGPESGDPHSHAAFPQLPNEIIKVTSHVRVTNAVNQGLNFFAIQVNFPNQTWAHGGPQLVGGKYQMNWGGLVSRGGRATDYREENPASDLLLMQNAKDSERSAPYAWVVGKEYVLTIERGKQVTFPPGQYVFIGSGPVVSLPNVRTMWEWKFTLKAADGHGPVQVSTLYDAADRISSFYIWNECGYGSCNKGQSAIWSMPVYTALGASGQGEHAQVFRRF
ncbi:hypothetical protein GCM10007898_18490 [Dyella flagellata]|uniref:Polysaccharide lyase n=2 Tax=Dyella flagellata TaxID=1867833 RepID=A0ABQ5X9L5_9GAMM|nr:hypothetical protein GCM10007898_18490 [Dyella flagellata]